MSSQQCGRNSVVECSLPKADVVGSNPIARFQTPSGLDGVFCWMNLTLRADSPTPSSRSRGEGEGACGEDDGRGNGLGDGGHGLQFIGCSSREGRALRLDVV